MQQNLETEEDQSATLAGANNKTFLGVDAILYPKDGKIGQAPAKKTQQRGKKSKLQELKIDPRLNLDGLKGYGKSAARVSTIMN